MNKAARSYGVETREQMARLSGRELLQGMIDGGLPGPAMAERLDFRLVEIDDGFAVFEGEPSEPIYNPMGVVHGGWALTLIDSAAACAGQTLLPAGTSYTTVETKANFSRPITTATGTVRAEGRVISQGRRIISTEARVLDARGRVLAHGTSTLLVFQTES